MSRKAKPENIEAIDPDGDEAVETPIIKNTKPAAVAGEGKQIITGETVLKILRDKGVRI